jgi:hypothetical protein
VAVIYLQTAGILQDACNSELEILIHPFLRDHQLAVITANREGEDLAGSLDEVRQVVRSALEKGKVVFLSRAGSAVDEDDLGDDAQTGAALLHFLRDPGPCDAVCIDDRFVNRHATISDSAGSPARVVCVLDILRYLERKAVITSAERREKIHRLREGGFTFIPLEPNELESLLRKARPDPEGRLVESAEMRVLRQTLMRIRTLDALQQPLETPFLDALRAVCVLVMRRLWQDETLPVEHTVSFSDWLWRSIAPAPTDWNRTSTGPDERSRTSEALARHVMFFLDAMPHVEGERHEAFCRWVEESVFRPLTPANPDLTDLVAEFVGTGIERFAEDMEKQEGAGAIAAKCLCNLQPLPIRVRLLRNQAFGEHFGLAPRTTITVGGKAQIDERELFAVARKALEDGREHHLRSEDGSELALSARADGVVVKGVSARGGDIEAHLRELAILSPRAEVRTQALDDMSLHLGPTVPALSATRAICLERELSDEEVHTLLDEITIGVTTLQARADRALAEHDASVEDLVPSTFEYYERFCGPNPGDMPPEEYLQTTLPAYRKELLRGDLATGLDICFLGALRDDLSPSHWTKDVADEELWSALTDCSPARDPFSLLGMLDIALYRQHDQRFWELADRAVADLLEERFPRPDGTDAYDLLPLLAELVLNRLNTLEGGALRAPYWKRMCAWMQAGLLGRLTAAYNFDLDAFRMWVRSNETQAGVYAAMIDLRREPMYRASEMSPQGLREEVVGRLAAIRATHECAGRVVPRSNDIADVLAAMAAQGSPLGWGLPGPLEGHRRPAELGRHTLPPDQATELLQHLSADPAGPAWSMAAYFSQVFALGDEVLTSARETLKGKDHLDLTGSEGERNLHRLMDAGLVAGAHRDVELARTIGASVVGTAYQVRSGEQALAVLRNLLVAGAAFEREEECAEWLEESLAHVSAFLPRGEPSRTFLEHLRALKEVTRVSLSLFSRAEAFSSASS